MRAFALVAIACLAPCASGARTGLARRFRRGQQEGHRHHGKTHQVPLAHLGWSMPPLTKIFRGSEKTAASLESNMERLKASVNDLRKKDLDDAKEVYASFAQALNLDDEQNSKLKADNEETEKKISALQLSNKAEEGRRDNLVKENKKLYKQLEELKKTVNSQVNGLEDILQEGGLAPKPAPEVVAVMASTAQASAPEYCHCTRSCSDLGWGSWCTVQSASCVTKSPCVTGGAAGSCVTVDPRDGPWTRCANIVAQPAAASLIQVSQNMHREVKKEEEDDDDSDDAKDDDEEDSEDGDVCQCKQPCTDEGWGMWCYVQSSSCRVKENCAMGGAAHACVASDPGGPWTRCENLLPVPSAVSAPAAQVAAAALSPPVAPAQEDMTRNTKPVKDVLVKMMTQVDDIRQEDEQSTEKLKEVYQQESKRLATEKDSIAQKKEELASELRQVKEESSKLATEVEHLEEVNRSLHTQLRRLEHFLASASTELKGSIETEDRVSVAAVQTSKAVDDAEKPRIKGHQEKVKEEKDSDEDDDDDDNDEDDAN